MKYRVKFQAKNDFSKKKDLILCTRDSFHLNTFMFSSYLYYALFLVLISAWSGMIALEFLRF